ncbi:hypothetical protein [Campylobacter sp. IFREMER_LSEM_CL2151]|uniref:hypothetical protein n=1 Tax=Campylobacter sp. IFREMER_LSEM_CL2151 TaxID=2911620 RepID=UPI0021E6D408|nr:hypothetical protein [Campylobacter sp. IFREMER_LSEM_CL2151]MCV3375241.1 hypothetical protein [Campylobacter sp. IFREMER_LSEM_CL2151]MCV3410554.1 hypothetical protein [Campylobacter lari]
MEKFIISNREDSNGTRFLGLISAFYVAKRNNIKPCFTWSESIEKLVATEMNLQVDKSFSNQKIISTNIDLKEDIFAQNFINAYCIEQSKINDIFSVYKESVNGLKHFEECIKKGDKTFYEAPFWMMYYWKDVDKEDYLKQAKYIWENEIVFTPKIFDIITSAKKQAEKIENYIALHIRNGDTVYSYANFRKYNLSTTYHATPYEIAIEIIQKELSLGNKIVVFTDDISSVEEILRIVKSKNIFFANDLRDFDSLTPTQMLIYDITLMSKADKIYGTYSAVTRLSSIIAGHGQHINPYELFSKKEFYNVMKKNFNLLKLHPDQKAFSLFHLYLSGLKNNEKFEILESYLKMALEFDNENDKYRIYIVDCLMKQGKIKAAEEYLQEIFKTRKKEFMSLLLPNKGESSFLKLLINYHINNSPKYKHIYDIYLKSLECIPKYFHKKRHKITLGKLLKKTYLRKRF